MRPPLLAPSDHVTRRARCCKRRPALLARSRIGAAPLKYVYNRAPECGMSYAFEGCRADMRTRSGRNCQKCVHVNSAVTCIGPNTSASAASLVETICQVDILSVLLVNTCRWRYHVCPKLDSRGP
jgi:hypothetical protein